MPMPESTRHRLQCSAAAWLPALPFALEHRIGYLPNVILHLAYAPHGTRLIPSPGRANGVPLYRTSDYNKMTSYVLTTNAPKPKRAQMVSKQFSSASS